MLKYLLGRKAATGAVAFTAPVRSDSLVYAIGDVHGRADLLRKLLQRIDREIGERGAPAEIVFLGDYVDRGDHVREVLDLLLERAVQGPSPVFLAGNHEQMLLDFVQEPDRGRRWLRYGGLQTLMSYNVGGLRGMGEGADLAPVRDRLVEAMGPHLAFLQERLSLTHRNGNVLFVHAAADPEAPPDQQQATTLLWGSPDFERKTRADDIWVVHGHTVVSAPRSGAGRIAVDTGAYFSGRLTAVRIDGGEVDFLTS